jgi:hypothetical protein
MCHYLRPRIVSCVLDLSELFIMQAWCVSQLSVSVTKYLR